MTDAELADLAVRLREEGAGVFDSADPSTAADVLTELVAEVIAARSRCSDDEVRADERLRLADWFDAEAETLDGLGHDGGLTAGIVAFLLRLMTARKEALDSTDGGVHP